MSDHPLNHNDAGQNFRSILPHERWPKNGVGYVLLHGAFTPKSFGNGESPSFDLHFWTSEQLESALSTIFTDSDSTYAVNGVKGIEVIDDGPPYTKAQLSFHTIIDAWNATVRWRTLSMTPKNLFQERFGSALCSFGSKQLMATPLVTHSLPYPCWNRPSPPKFRRLLQRRGERLDRLDAERRTSRWVFVSNLLNLHFEKEFHDIWPDPLFATAAIRSVVDIYDQSGHGTEIFCVPNKLGSYCHVGFRNADDAQSMLAALQDQAVQWKWTDEHGNRHEASSGRLFLDHAAITYRSKNLKIEGFETSEAGLPPSSDCTSTTNHVHVPGLVLVPDFVSTAEEACLLATLQGPHAPWAPSQRTPAGGIIKRRVQHYGYVFDYLTADVLRDREKPGADCPPLPGPTPPECDGASLQAWTDDKVSLGRGWDVMAGVLQRIRSHQFNEAQLWDEKNATTSPRSFADINQVTVNFYEPGEGIGSHVDTPSAFDDGLLSLSLNGGIVMEFRRAQKDGFASRDNRKLVYLPPRSLLLLSGPARYQWEHMIVSRRTDTHNGIVVPRTLRVSLTCRAALSEIGAILPRIESDNYPLKWGVPSKRNALATPECEKQHVHAVYDAIAMQWHHTRGKRGVLWPGATEFLQRLPPCSIVADVGCGDGKYFSAIWEAGSFVVGTDISRPLLMTALRSAKLPSESLTENCRVAADKEHFRRHPELVVADCMNVPLRDNGFDAAICIAVMHHISTAERRRRCIAELARIVKPGGLINIQAWALEQQDDSRRKFAADDVFVPFNAQPKYLELDKDKCVPGQHPAEAYAGGLNAEFDSGKGLVVFQRYCHLYRKGELEEIVASVPTVRLVESGFESGNYFVILENVA